MWTHRTGPQIWAYVVVAPSRKGWCGTEGTTGDRFGNSEPVRNVVRQFSWPVPPNTVDFHLGPSSVSARTDVYWRWVNTPFSIPLEADASFVLLSAWSITVYPRAPPRRFLAAPTTTVIIIRSSDRATRSLLVLHCPSSLPFHPLLVSHDPHSRCWTGVRTLCKGLCTRI